MPDVTTNRTRDVTISGTVSFGTDTAAIFAPSYLHPGGLANYDRHRWSAEGQVDYWGIAVVASASVHLPEYIDGVTPEAPSVTLTLQRGGYSKSVTVDGTPYVAKPYPGNENELFSLQYLDVSTGTGSFSEVVHCVQHFNPGPYEARTGVSFTFSASYVAHIIDTQGGGSQTISASLTMTDADIPGFAGLGYSGYQYAFEFSGCPVHFHVGATIGFDQPGLASTYAGAIDTTFGYPHLHGSASGCTFYWDGAETTINTGQGGGPYWIGDDGTGAVPSAGIVFAPSWAMAVNAAVYHYRDGTEVHAGLQDWSGTALVSGFTSGSTYQYPPSGLMHYVSLGYFNSGQQSDGTGMQAGSPVLAGNNYGPVAQLLQVPGGAPAGAARTFNIDPAWADTYGTYPSSTVALEPKLWQPYAQGTISFADVHRFQLFEDTGPATELAADVPAGSTDLPVLSEIGFAAGDLLGSPETLTVASTSAGHIIVTSATGAFHAAGTAVFKGTTGAAAGSRWTAVGSGAPSFPGASPHYDGTPSIRKVSGTGIDGYALEVAAEGATLVTSAYTVLHQGYRYAVLRLKASALSTTVVGSLLAGATDLPVVSSDGFQVGDNITVGPEPATVSAVSTGHLTVSPLATAHPSGATVRKAGGVRVVFILTGADAGGIGWMLTGPSTRTVAAAAAGATFLSCADVTGFEIGQQIQVGAGASIETLPVTAVATGGTVGLGTTATANPHAAGEQVTLAPGQWWSASIDLAKPQYEEYQPVAGTYSWRATAKIVHPDQFVPPPAGIGKHFGAFPSVYLLDAGTVTLDYLEGQLGTSGSRTPRIVFPFLEQTGDGFYLSAYEFHSPENPAPTPTPPEQWFTWVVNGVRGATVRPEAVTGFGSSIYIDNISEKWQYLKNKFDSQATNAADAAAGLTHPNDTGITVTIGTLDDPDPFMVFGPQNQGVFDFGGGDPSYGLKPALVSGSRPQALRGQLRENGVAAYYGCGDLTAISGAYGATVLFTMDWVLDGEAIIQAGAPGAALTLNDNNTGTLILSATTDDDGMARLPARYGTVHPNGNVSGAVQWFPIVQPSTTLTHFALAGDTSLQVASSSLFTAGDVIQFSGLGSSYSSTTVTAVPDSTHLTVAPMAAPEPSAAVVTKQGPPYPTIGYTTLGLVLNSDWLGGQVQPKDAAGYWGSGSPVVRTDIVILNRYESFYTAFGRLLRGIWNIHDRMGAYHRADVQGGKIRYHRSDVAVPPFVSEVDATAGPADAQPRMSASGMDRIHLLFTQGTGAAGVMLTWSDDDGETWSTPVSLFSGGKHPANAETDVGTVIHAAYVGGQIHALEEIAPEQYSPVWTFVDASGAPLVIDDDSFSFSLAKEGAARWVLVAAQSATVYEWDSGDDCRTWERVG